MIHLLITWILAPLALLRMMLTRKPASPQNILLIQTAKIGDYICTTPLIRALRMAYPRARLSLLVNPITEPLAFHQPGVDCVFVQDKHLRGFARRLELYRLIRREAFDTTVCISPNQAFLLLPFLAGARWRASILPNFGGRSYRLATPFVTVAETHLQGRQMVETGMALLRQLGKMPTLPEKEIVPAPNATERVAAAFPSLADGTWIGLGVSSGNKLKELRREQLDELTGHFLALGHGVVLIGTAADQTLAGGLCHAKPSSRLIDSTGKIALQDLAALIDRLSLYVGVDSGITYLADARGVPVIDIMGPADPEDQRPNGVRSVIVCCGLSCAPCSHAFLAPYFCATGTRACIAQTNQQRIVDAARQVLRYENRSL